jgi:hypothetical protein
MFKQIIVLVALFAVLAVVSAKPRRHHKVLAHRALGPDCWKRVATTYSVDFTPKVEQDCANWCVNNMFRPSYMKEMGGGRGGGKSCNDTLLQTNNSRLVLLESKD